MSAVLSARQRPHEVTLYVPLSVLLASISQLFPVITGVVKWRGLTRPRVWIVVLAALNTLVTVVQVAIAQSRRSNLWLSYISLPAEVALLLWAFAYWQVTARMRTTFRAAIPAALVLHGVLVWLVEDVTGFSAVSGPAFGLLGLAAALYTLVTRAIDETEPLPRQDWFWISGGFALYFGSLATIMPLARLLVGDHPAMVMRAWELFAVMGIVSNVAIAIGMLCPSHARPVLAGAALPPSLKPSPT